MPCAIPTRYRGITFRSRLEARWASMFDQFGWRWLYEPEDWHAYVGDFGIRTESNGLIYVEVKPIYQYDDAAAAIFARMLEASPHRELVVMLAGGAPNIFGNLHSGPDPRCEENCEAMWGPLLGVLWCGMKGRQHAHHAAVRQHRAGRFGLGFFHDLLREPSNPNQRGGGWFSAPEWDHRVDVEAMWRAAGNVVPWTP